jgi:hypothetical protein
VGFIGERWGHERSEEAAGDGQADALRLGDAGERGQGVGIDEHGLLELAAERRAFGAEAVDLVLEIRETPPGVGAIDGLENLGASRVSAGRETPNQRTFSTTRWPTHGRPPAGPTGCSGGRYGVGEGCCMAQFQQCLTDVSAWRRVCGPSPNSSSRWSSQSSRSFPRTLLAGRSAIRVPG